LAFNIASENTVNVVWWIGVAINIFAVLLMLQVLAFRSLVLSRERKRQRVEKFWQPILLESVANIRGLRIPHLNHSEAYEFLTVLNSLYESLHDRSVERLSAAAIAAGGDIAARGFLKNRNIRQRLMAVTALGNLRDKESWNLLVQLADQPNDPILAFAATQALVQIDPQKGIGIAVEFVASRYDWPLEAVSTMFENAGRDVISVPLSIAVLAACRAEVHLGANPAVRHAPRLIYLMRLAHRRFITHVVSHVLLTMTGVEVVAAALKVLNDPLSLPVVRRLLRDERWQIRVNAANALGRTKGTPQDERLLIGALHDNVWWVSYRAAQALVGLPTVRRKKLEAYISSGQMDDFACDMLRQVMAEKDWA
jgi:hypothetical protein